MGTNWMWLRQENISHFASLFIQAQLQQFIIKCLNNSCGAFAIRCSSCHTFHWSQEIIIFLLHSPPSTTALLPTSKLLILWLLLLENLHFIQIMTSVMTVKNMVRVLFNDTGPIRLLVNSCVSQEICFLLILQLSLILIRPIWMYWSVRRMLQF